MLGQRVIGNILGNKPKADKKSRNNEETIKPGQYKVSNGRLVENNDTINDKAMILKTEKTNLIMDDLSNWEGSIIVSYHMSPYEVYKKINRWKNARTKSNK